MNLSRQEQETIILFNESEDTAEIETFNPRLLKQLRKVSVCEGVSCGSDDGKYGVYEIPKTMIKIYAPRTLNLSEEQRQASSKRIKAHHAQRHKINFEV